MGCVLQTINNYKNPAYVVTQVQQYVQAQIYQYQQQAQAAAAIAREKMQQTQAAAAIGVGMTLISICQLGLDPATDVAAGAGDALAAVDMAAAASADAEAAAAEATATEEEAALTQEEEAAACGGMSFSPGTKVLLANGASKPISKLKVGDKVIATNTRTGKTRAETVTAVLLHHDTDLYNLKIRTRQGTAIIRTTSTHLFWDTTQRQWVKAASLPDGDHLRTRSGSTATAIGGSPARPLHTTDGRAGHAGA